MNKILINIAKKIFLVYNFCEKVCSLAFAVSDVSPNRFANLKFLKGEKYE
jgi:uncharacterized metal-binding protein